MATDYKKIAEEHEKRYGWDVKPRRIYKRLYNDKTHFVYELIQNADDNESLNLELQLDKNELFVWNDGYQFSEEDVRNICSLGSSNKDLTQIGTFGIGFKAVYNYTDFPEIYSGAERFLIRDLIKPESIAEMDFAVAKQVGNGKTVFHLPFKDGLRQEDIERLKNRLLNLNKRALLFLRHLEMVHWRDARDAQEGSYSCHRQPHSKIQNASEVKLTVSLNGDNQPSETFLVFRKEVQPPQDVINQLLQQEEDDEDRHRIKRSAEKLQPVEVAFKVQDGGVTPIDDCVLFAYLPTQKETHLRFLIQARYQTTPARDNISNDNPWNKWLVQETANFLPDVLEQLKAGGLLTPTFFNVMPLRDDNVPVEYGPISESLGRAMRDRSFVPTQNGGYAKAEHVLYPHAESLRQLIKSDWMHPNNWLHPEIRNTKEFRRCFRAICEAGVEIASTGRVLRWLERKTPSWLEGRCSEWLCSLYVYLNSQKSELKRIKKLPLVRLESGKHVCADNQSVFFPPDQAEVREDMVSFFMELPILQSSLLAGNTRNVIETFLKSLGVRMLHPEDLIRESICPRYLQTEKPTEAQNRAHVRYLRHFLSKASKAARSSLSKEISKIPILSVYRGNQRKPLDFLEPCNAYLSQAYTSDTSLETYFSECGNVWYVDDNYIENDSDRKKWLQFFKSIDVMETPRVIEENLTISSQNRQELDKRGLEWKNSKKGLIIEDRHFDGLPEVLARVSNHKEMDLAQVLWHLLVKALPSGESQRDALFQGIYRWGTYSSQFESFQAMFYRQLQKAAWLPDEQENFRVPAECFAPTSENRKVLGDSVAYLHPDFDISQDSEAARWLARKLGVHLDANMDSVLNYLQALSRTGVSVEQVKPLYCFLAQQNSCRSEEFKQKPLIFTSNPETNWWKLDKVFWEDENPVFGNHRGYLRESYADNEAILKPFFIALGVSERAAPLDYVRVIREVTSVELADDATVRERVKILYGRLWQSLQESGNLLNSEEWEKEWEQTRDGKCWLGKNGSKWDFYPRYELVWNDHPHVAGVFEGEVPFWKFDGSLLDLAKHLEVECCSRAVIEVQPCGVQEEDKDWSARVRDLRPYIHAFLNSPSLCELQEDKSAHILDFLSVRLVEKLETAYTLKKVSLIDPNAPQSFLDVTDQKVVLWLALEAGVSEYAELIGDALQGYFDVRDLGRFAEDLLTKKRDRVLSRWQQKGLEIDICLMPETDTKKGEGKQPIPINEELPAQSNDEDANLVKDESDTGILVVDEISEHSSGMINSRTDESGHHEYTPRSSGTSWSGGHSISTSSGKSKGKGHSGHYGSEESDEHRELKEYLAAKTFELGIGLKLVEVEYTFGSGDRVDILLKDDFGNPVTVEVEIGFSSKAGRYIGIWQAIKYQHLAAVEYGLPCEQVRSILAAPEIPEDIKKKCKELGIEPIEVSNQTKA